LDGDPVLTLDLNDPENWNVGPLDLEWDATRPTSVSAGQVFPADGVSSSEVTDSGLVLLDARGLSDFSGQTTAVLLAAPADTAEEITLRAQGLLADSGWFARCEGEADVARLQGVLRVGDLVAVQGIGSLHSGNYLVWSVRHTIAADSHKSAFRAGAQRGGPAAVLGRGIDGASGGIDG
jgi:hypothetical protein